MPSRAAGPFSITAHDVLEDGGDVLEGPWCHCAGQNAHPHLVNLEDLRPQASKPHIALVLVDTSGHAGISLQVCRANQY